MVTPNDFRVGLLIRYRGQIYEILEYSRVKIAQRRAFVRTKMKELISGRILTENLDSEEEFEDVPVERRKCQFLYADNENYHFMELEHYETFFFSKDSIKEKTLYLPLAGNIEVEILYLDGKPATLELPNFVELEVVETEPDYKGDTATGGGKPAKLETGLVISVPYFITPGDVVRIDTRTNTYIERMSKGR